MHDVDLNGNAICHEIVYADDTLLIDAAGDHLQAYMECVAARGKTYGLALNFSKVESMAVNCEYLFKDPEGNSIINKSHLKDLGAQIAADGSIDSELGQKLGIAARDFKKLQ